MKYKLINSVTKIETICDKITIDGFDYYVSDEKVREEQWYITKEGKLLRFTGRYVLGDKLTKDCKQVIATNNPILDIPKVVDDVEELALKETLSQIDLVYNTEQRKKDNKKSITVLYFEGLGLYKAGYNKSQETHPFSEEDLIEFSEWCRDKAVREFVYGIGETNDWELRDEQEIKTTKELLQLWKEQKPKIVYYEN